MRHVICLLWFLATAGLVSLTTPCMAEMHMYQEYDERVITLSGGIIAPASPQKGIRMDLMEINIRLKTGSYVLDAVFHLFNTGEATTEWIGFPKHGKAVDYISEDNRLIRDFIRFEGWVNGRKEMFVEKHPFLRGNSYPFPEPRKTGFAEETRWMATKLTFPKNTVITVRIRCEAPYNYRMRSVPEDVGEFFFGPGQYWKGKIAKAKIVLTNPDSGEKHRGMLVTDPGTTSTKKTVSTTEIKYELSQLVPLARGFLTFTQTLSRQKGTTKESE